MLFYLAGVFDGEGCVLSEVTKTGFSKVSLVVKMTYKPILDLFQKTFGGYVSAPECSGKLATKYSYRWCVGSTTNAKEVAEILLVHGCMEKRSQLEAAIEFYALPKDGSAKAERIALAERIAALKKSEYECIPLENTECHSQSSQSSPQHSEFSVTGSKESASSSKPKLKVISGSPKPEQQEQFDLLKQVSS